jgi:hypothetical protein
VAGTDNRVKAAAPSVGGSGFRTEPWPLLPQAKKESPNGDVRLYGATIGFESYAPLIKAPLFWLSATNDFHGIMDDTYRTGALIPHKLVRYAFTPHMNHQFTPEFAVGRLLWFDQYLKGTFTFPATPKSRLDLSSTDGVATLRVTPDDSMPIADVRIFYSVDPHPQARFWRSADGTQEGSIWAAKLPILSLDQPLFAFVNVHYRLKQPQAVLQARPTETFAISSLMYTATPDDLRRASVKATDTVSLVIDDFSHGWRDWYTLSADNPHHWQFWTRKISDPKWQGRPGQRLAFDVRCEKPNDLVIVLTENFFRSYRGKQQEFVTVVKLMGGDSDQAVSLSPEDFKTVDGKSALASWSNVDLLGIRAYHEEGGKLLGSKAWKGPQPSLRNLRWLEGQ